MGMPAVTMGANLMCTFGVAPASLVVVPMGPPVLTEAKPQATVMDFKPMVNIPTFAMCQSPANPAVIALTAAKLGVFSPAPCIPATTAPWTPGSPQTMVNGVQALVAGSSCMCMWGGVISVTNPGSTKTMA